MTSAACRLALLGPWLTLGLALTSCQRTSPIEIPASASLYVTAARVEHLALFDGAPDLAGFDRSAPGWAFCEGGVCALGGKPAAGTSPTLDGDDHVVTWSRGAANEVDALARWRAWERPTLARRHDSKSMLHGHIAPDPLLSGFEFQKPRSRELLVRASHQLEALEFDADLVGDDLHATLHLRPRPGEPRFVSGLGSAAGDLSDLGGLVDADVAAIARISADPQALWQLLRSAIDVAGRAELDRYIASMSDEFGIDHADDLLASLTGHLAVIAYSVDPKQTPAQWFSGAATREAVFVGISNQDAIRRLLDAGTQLSRGKLNTRRVDGERTQWAWVEDGVLKWTVILGAHHVLIVDSPVAFEYASRLESPEQRADVLVERGVPDLLGGSRRSGLYLDTNAITALFPPASRWSKLRWLSVVADEETGHEVVRLKLGGFKKD